MENFFTVDLEEWHHRICYKSITKKNNFEDFNSSSIGVNKILNILEENNCQATFFVVGEVALKRPELIEKIVDMGHEISSHTFSHTPLNKLNKRNFLIEMKKTDLLLRKISKEKVLGFRAPKFSLKNKTSWAIDTLKEMNYLYDSSIIPSKLLGYGTASAPYHPYKIDSEKLYIPSSNKSSIMEYPVLTYPFGKLNLPCKLRHTGLTSIMHSIKKTNKLGYPGNFLLHPWELLPKNYRGNNLIPSGISKFLRQYNIPCDNKLKSLVKNFKFTSIRNYIESN